MPNFLPYDYNQNAMVVINYLDQLQPGTFEHAIHFLVSHKLDLSVYFSAYKNNDNGRPAYDPAILIKIILFAYSKGITSSREIEWCCQTILYLKPFPAIPCHTTPRLLVLSAVTHRRLKRCSNKFFLPVMSRVYWGTSCLQ